MEKWDETLFIINIAKESDIIMGREKNLMLTERLIQQLTDRKRCLWIIVALNSVLNRVTAQRSLYSRSQQFQ